MTKFDDVKMVDLVKVEDPNAEGGISLVFKNNKVLKFKVADGKLVSEINSE